MATRINFIDLYSFYDEIDSYIIESLMDTSNISFSIRTLAPGLRPDEMSGLFERRVAVEEERLDTARDVISQAIRNGVISKEGKFRV